MIKWASISKSFRLESGKQLNVLNNANLEIKKHEFLTLYGKSGSGKSTIMYILGLLDRPNSGAYYFDDQLTSEINDAELAKIRNQDIGFVFQQFMLLPQLTVEQNVALPLTYNKAINISDHRSMVEKLLLSLGMIDFIDEKPNQLSGGQQQRIAIARSLICQPKLLLADEPTGSLDYENTQHILKLFQRINNDFGTTIVMVTHDKSWSNFSSRVLNVAEGLIA